jgi:hypothetical protein
MPEENSVMEIFTPNALEMNLLSNDVKLHPNDWTFLKLSAVEREIYNIVGEISSFTTENIKFTPFYFPINLCMQKKIHFLLLLLDCFLRVLHILPSLAYQYNIETLHIETLSIRKLNKHK